MKIVPLPFETVALIGFTHKVIITSADLTAAAGSQTFTIFPDGSADGYNQQTGLAMQDTTLNQLPAGFTVEKTQIRVVTPFTGGAISAATVSVGDKASTARYIAAASTDLFTAAGTNTKDNVASATTYAFTTTDVANSNAALVAVIATTGANVSAATAGQLEIYFAVCDVSEQATVTGT
jgi:hypothetical protein